jgi:hypothetical protein
MSPVAILAVIVMTCDFLLVVAFQWLYGNGRRKRVEGIILLKHKPKVLPFPARSSLAGITARTRGVAEQEVSAYRRIADSFLMKRSRA